MGRVNGSEKFASRQAMARQEGRRGTVQMREAGACKEAAAGGRVIKAGRHSRPGVRNK